MIYQYKKMMILLYAIWTTLIYKVYSQSNCNDAFMNHAKENAVKWRKYASELFCKFHSKDSIQASGGWCESPPEKGKYGYELWNRVNETATPALHRVPADPDIAKVIAKYTLDRLGNKPISIVDIGAGVGQYGRWFNHYEPKIEYHGFDGSGNIESFTNGFVSWIDVTDPLFHTVNVTADFVMSLEVAEHIPASTVPAFLDLLDRHNRYGIILSWARKGARRTRPY